MSCTRRYAIALYKVLLHFYTKFASCFVYYSHIFFAATDRTFRLKQFLLTTISSPELLDAWIEAICSWLRRSEDGRKYRLLDLRCALTFAMGGSMHLYQHQDELGIDYRFICPHHIRAILEFLGYSNEKIDGIIRNTDEWIVDADVDRFLDYCREHIDWVN